MNESYYRYWGKAREDGSYHLLPYHCLDVAAVAAAWWDASPSIRHGFRLHNTLPEEQLRAWVLFFTALHDYGKFDIRFQLRSKASWGLLYPDANNFRPLPSEYDCKHYYHGESGLFWFMKDYPFFSGSLNPLRDTGLSFLDDPNEAFAGDWSVWKVWLEAVMGHHGHIKLAEYVTDMALPPSCDTQVGIIDRQARKDWFAVLEQMFLRPMGLSLENSRPPPCSPLMAGFCSVSDWLGSRSDSSNFTYLQRPKNLGAYFEEHFNNDACRILEFAGVISAPHPYSGVKTLLGLDQLPHSVQTIVDDLPVKPGLTIVEAPTGSGKTEAALSYAWRLIDAGSADSIVFALPTQATANAMLERIELLATKLFDKHPNVLLAHGSARFNKSFVAIKHAALEGYEGEDGWLQCSEWLAESRKRVFLGQIGVCTVDQVLISVLPVRHRFVRGFGIGRSVLIVDEVHAYDAYMYGLLEEVLRNQKESGGAAILL
ncbi:MAG: CRISPR-associated helicase/endonuclease Cas3, partial [Thermodesulfobacteriota bacterium]